MTVMPKAMEAAEVRTGDLIVMGTQSHRVLAIEPYEHPTLGHTAGIARCEQDWSITLFPGTILEVAR